MDEALLADVTAIGQVMSQLGELERYQLVRDLARFDLTVPQYSTLKALERSPGGCTMTALAEATYQLSATMTGVVDRLADRGLVTRARDPKDRRAWRSHLTDAGRTLLAEVAARRQEWWTLTLSRMPGDDRQALLHLLRNYLDITRTEAGRP